MCEVALGKEDITPHSAARLLLLADRHNLAKLEKVGSKCSSNVNINEK